MLTHTGSSPFIFKGKILMKEEGVLVYSAGRWHWSLLLCQNANIETHSHDTLTAEHLAFSVIQNRATFLSTHFIQVFPISASSTKPNMLLEFWPQRILSRVCLEKVGQDDVFTTQTTSIANHTKQGQWNGCVSVERRAFTVLYWELPSLLTLHPANFQYASYGPGLGRSHNLPDAEPKSSLVDL